MPLYNPLSGANIVAGSVTTADLADSSVTSAKITDATVAVADLSATGTPSSSTYLRGDNTWATISAGLGLTPTAVKTSGYTAAAEDLVPVDTTSGAVTVTLPTAPADGTAIAVQHTIQGSTNAVTIARGGSDVFRKASGATSLSLSLASQGVVLQYKAAAAVWYVVAETVPLATTDARYAQVSNNLSDVTAASARTNLGLGTAATISSTAGGDLSGTLPSPTVAKVNGVAVTGTPAAGYVPTATGTTAATWQSAVGGAIPAELMPAYVYGDSYTVSPGVLCTSGAEGHTRAAKRLNLGTVTGYGVAGYSAAMVTQRAYTGNALDADGGAITRAGTWTAGTTGIVLIDAGRNDNYYTGGINAVTTNAVDAALTALCAVVSCGTRVEETSGTIAYGGPGTWAANSDANTLSGGTNKKVTGTVLGSTVTISIPSAGDWWLFSSLVDNAFFAVTSPTSWGVTVGGVTKTDWLTPQVTKSRSAGSAICPTAYKVTTTGAQSVVLTAKGAGSSFGSFDFYAPASSTAPLVILRKQVYWSAYTGYAGAGGAGGTDAGIDAVNTTIASVAAKFTNVVVSDPTTAWDKTTMLGSDGIHPNDKGMSCIADADSVAIKTAVFRLGLNK